MKEKSTGKKSNQKTNLEQFSKMSDAEIDGGIAADSGALQTNVEFWESAEVVMPKNKEMITIRLDADLLDWFKQNKGYQTRINAILRSYMEAHQKRL